MIKIIFTAVLLLSSFFINGQTVFTHIATTLSIDAEQTEIDNKTINGDANKLLFVTQVFSDYYNNHSFGVDYGNGKWRIKQGNKIAIDSGAIYNVLAVNPSENAFINEVNNSNSSNDWTIINHPNCNDNPNAILLVTQNYAKVENSRPIGVRYELGKWRIFNQDKSPMPINASFNILVITETFIEFINGEAFIFTATDSKTNEYFTHLSNLPYEGNDTKIFTTQNQDLNNITNVHETAVWNSGPNWTIYNKDRANLPTDAQFNLLVINGTKLTIPNEKISVIDMPKTAVKPVSKTRNMIRFLNQSEYIAGAVITYIHDGELQKKSTKRLAAKEAALIEIPAGVSDIKILLQFNDILWVKIDEIDIGIEVVNNCYQFLGTMDYASYDNNCEVKP